ncbi:VWA domain-containing protein, partial [Myxococcota bacterium]|nr:VWA domain-containing protein [Myxococcota bacterium]
VSDSMLVQDGEVGDNLTRIERAKREIQDLITRLDGDRIALVAFAGEAFVESPLTLDYSAARMFLDEIDTDIIPVKGTAIGAALERSLEAFDGGQSASKAILLITDGEDHTNLAQKAAEKAKEAGVRIFAIGIGRNEGAPVPGPDGGFRRDKMGQIILSRLDEHTLQKIAITTGGRYVRSVSGDMDLEEIYESGIKAELKSRELGSKRQKLWKERFQIFLLIALLLLAIEPFISERIRERDNA